MGVSIRSVLYLGFVIDESELYTDVGMTVNTCPKGHERNTSDEFCSKDGGKFERRSVRTVSAFVLAIFSKVGTGKVDLGFVNTWTPDRLVERLRDDDGAPLFILDNGTHVIGRQISRIRGSDYRALVQPLDIPLADLESVQELHALLSPHLEKDRDRPILLFHSLEIN